jgi:hypothetical protein
MGNSVRHYLGYGYGLVQGRGDCGRSDSQYLVESTLGTQSAHA